MSSWKTRLREADAALARELSPERARLLRQKVLVEAGSVSRLRSWSLPFALTTAALAAASAALVVSTAIAVPDTLPVVGDVPADEAEMVPQAGSGRQQLHFATPGGTRIIWVFDADFEVKGTLP